MRCFVPYSDSHHIYRYALRRATTLEVLRYCTLLLELAQSAPTLVPAFSSFLVRRDSLLPIPSARGHSTCAPLSYQHHTEHNSQQRRPSPRLPKQSCTCCSASTAAFFSAGFPPQASSMRRNPSSTPAAPTATEPVSSWASRSRLQAHTVSFSCKYDTRYIILVSAYALDKSGYTYHELHARAARSSKQATPPPSLYPCC